MAPVTTTELCSRSVETTDSVSVEGLASDTLDARRLKPEFHRIVTCYKIGFFLIFSNH